MGKKITSIAQTLCWFLVLLFCLLVNGSYVVWFSNWILHLLQNSLLQHNSGYKPADLKECVLIIHDLQLSKRGSSLVAVRDKYKQHKVYIQVKICFVEICLLICESYMNYIVSCNSLSAYQLWLHHLQYQMNFSKIFENQSPRHSLMLLNL